MKKITMALFLAVLFAGFMVTAVNAGGDKVRGENGEGDTTQVCVNFDECPYGDYNPEDPQP